VPRAQGGKANAVVRQIRGFRVYGHSALGSVVFFAVRLERGGRWDWSRDLREQDGLRANRAVDRGRDLFARASSDGAAKRRLPALGAHRRVLEPKVGKHRSLIDVTGDLLRAALGGDVLGACELRAATLSGKVQQITGNERHCPAGTLPPRSVGGRIHHDLTNDSPARMMGVAASDEKARERLGNGGCPRLGSVGVKMTQCGIDVAPVVDRSRELHRTPPWLVC
jgi:hypothetical protein